MYQVTSLWYNLVALMIKTGKLPAALPIPYCQETSKLPAAIQIDWKHAHGRMPISIQIFWAIIKPLQKAFGSHEMPPRVSY